MDPGRGSAAVDDRERLRLSNRSIVVVVVLAAGAPFVLSQIGGAGRVLGWFAVAIILAGLLHPIVATLAARIPRGIAIPVVLLVTVGSIGGLVYLGYDDLQTQGERLEEAAPDAARRLEERDDGVGEAAREVELEERVREFVDQLPDRLRGGDTASALRSAATRGVAFFATGVLTIFLISHGPRLFTAGLAQIHDVDRRARLQRVLGRAYRRAWRYTVLTLGRAIIAGLFGLLAASLADVPGRTLLALWLGVWSFVPLLGVVVGSIPLLLLTGALDPDRLVLVSSVVLVYQTLEVVLVQRRLEGISVHVGPVITLVAAMAGLEAYGIGGACVSLVLAILGVSLVKELAPSEDDDLIAAADAVLPGDEP